VFQEAVTLTLVDGTRPRMFYTMFFKDAIVAGDDAKSMSDHIRIGGAILTDRGDQQLLFPIGLAASSHGLTTSGGFKASDPSKADD